MGHRIRIENTAEGTSILQALQARGEYIPAPCGGNGTCGKCRVRFVQDPPAPSQADRKVLTEAEIADGVRLACRTAAVQGAVIEIEAGDEKQMDVASGFTLDVASGRVPVQRDIVDGEKDTEEGGTIAAAVDIGTTTIAMSAVDIGSGRILGTSTGINHQRSWGADVISRMEASNQGKGALLQKSIRADLDLLREELGLAQDARMVISGNSTMEHLLQGLSCETLGVAPYTPVDISLHEYENMTILPGISTFVGADIVSGIVACGIDQSEEICILVDLGTNGEMAIGNRNRIISASTAAGPAFEGGNISCGVAGIPGAVSSVEITDGEARVETIGGLPPVGLCGTGVLETVYELLKEELVERLTAALNSAKKYPRAYVVCTGGGTASENESASEAGEMAKWLIGQGVEKNRVIVEDNSITTAQNAIFTYDILTSLYPSVKKLAIVSSDYHIATGELLFKAESILRANAPGNEKLEVISNAAWKAPSGSLSAMFQAGALIELFGDVETAFDIYYDNYDIHGLPPLH